MMLEGNNASSAIKWVRQDLDDTLQSVRDNLEAYAADKSEREPLKAVQERLEQLNLTFLTMSQKGASILTDEMIAVGGHMLHNDSINQEDSLAALTDAVIVLPSYLDRLQAGHDDLPILLLPTLNDLRATYDETLMSEGTLFAPQLDIIIPELGGNETGMVSPRDFGTFSRRIRNLYQTALLGWLKEQSKTELLLPLQEVCEKLHSRLSRHPLRRLWWIAEMTIAGFRDSAIDNDLPLRRLFARLDITLKAMTEGGQDGPSDDALTALSRALLFHAAQARPGSRTIDLLRSRFKLEELIPDREALLRARGAVTGRDADLFHSIGEAVREEMNMVKDTLDMELRTGRVEKEQRETSMSSLRQLADTLEMLNLPVAAKAVEDLLPGLEEIEGTVNDSLDSPLIRLAKKLIEVESILDTHIKLLGEPVEEESVGYIELPAQEQRLILNDLLDECVVSLQVIQDAIRLQLGGDKDAGFDEPLEQISGALKLAGQREVAALTDKLGRVLHAGLHAKANGASDEEVQLDSLTDAVAALELYLAGCRDEQANSLEYLKIMHSRLDGLPEATASGEEHAQTEIRLSTRPSKSAASPAEMEKTDTGAAAGTSAIDPDLLDIFLEEFDSVSSQLTELLPTWLTDAGEAKTLIEVKRGFHTLKGSGRMVGAMEIGDFAWRVEDVLNRILENKLQPDDTVTGLVRLAIAALPNMKARLLEQDNELKPSAISAFNSFAQKLSQGDAPLLDTLVSELPDSIVSKALSEAVVELEESELTGTESEQAPQMDAAVAETAETQAAESVEPESDPDIELAQLMVAEIRQIIDQLDVFVWSNEPATEAVSKDLVRAAHTLAGTFATSPLGQEAEVARGLEAYLETLLKNDSTAKPEATQVLSICLHRFRQRLSSLEYGYTSSYPLDDKQLIGELADITSGVTASDSQPEEITEDLEVAAIEPATAPVVEPEPTAEPIPEIERDPALVALEEGGILAIFLEEATEVLERCDTLLNTWRDKLSDQKLVQNLQREIHTFKGGARMAGLEALGDLSHSMETLLERIAANRLQATVASVQALEEGCDHLTIWVEQLIGGQMPDAGDALDRFEKKAEALSVLPGGKSARKEKAAEPAPEIPQAAPETDSRVAKVDHEEPIPVPREEAAQPEQAEEVLLEAEESRPDIADAVLPASKKPAREFHEVQDSPAIDSPDDSSSQAQIRVAAELMDSLVNYAGEISIYRARLEQQLGTVRANLKDVGQTVGRLKEQLRKMDMETEAQMLSRYQNASTNQSSPEFDPLELDRFSNMQQLSRALTESASDLINLQDMLEDSVRQAESLLVQQSRVSSDLQDGLMQTRMTPFGSAAPRLRRVVRAAAAETGKRARLHLKMAGATDQLDRNVLERITAPLEHMLRNAVVHGIEGPRVRRKHGKPEEGEIIVTVEAEATEFVVRVEDDGGGVNLKAVRTRALERGMIGKGEKVDDTHLTNFILESGFSTAETVTGLAGRGVGMDVVSNEIKQIGGAMEIESVAGKGTLFTIRIPFSLAVMQAIGITVGSSQFLVPLNSVGGVARMLPSDYTALRQDEAPSYEFAGETYPVLELEPLLGEQPIPVDSENVSLLMIRSGERKAAFRVAELQGHQEVIIKPVGPQVSSIPGILGATISADGEVVIILDMGPIIRRGLDSKSETVEPAEPEPVKQQRQPLVMVVDDSITMRKVTSRVLENHALEVMTAQDGLDAIESLHDRIPDLMLLDIEMPRMDGYELAEHVRGDPRLKHIPIVMITSRAGQKHRKKAREAGANAYLTKPYQETELVAQVSEMLQMDLLQRRAE